MSSPARSGQLLTPAAVTDMLIAILNCCTKEELEEEEEEEEATPEEAVTPEQEGASLAFSFT